MRVLLRSCSGVHGPNGGSPTPVGAGGCSSGLPTFKYSSRSFSNVSARRLDASVPPVFAASRSCVTCIACVHIRSRLIVHHSCQSSCARCRANQARAPGPCHSSRRTITSQRGEVAALLPGRQLAALPRGCWVRARLLKIQRVSKRVWNERAEDVGAGQHRHAAARLVDHGQAVHAAACATCQWLAEGNGSLETHCCSIRPAA